MPFTATHKNILQIQKLNKAHIKKKHPRTIWCGPQTSQLAPNSLQKSTQTTARTKKKIQNHKQSQKRQRTKTKHSKNIKTIRNFESRASSKCIIKCSKANYKTVTALHPPQYMTTLLFKYLCQVLLFSQSFPMFSIELKCSI